MIDPRSVTAKAVWMEVVDPDGSGISRVPAARLSHYLAKGFKRAAEGPSDFPCTGCGFVAKSAKGLRIHSAKRHG